MASTQIDDEGINGINVTPLVDITFVLLIIFMVTAKLIAGQALQMDLPKASTAGTTQTMFTVSVDEGGKTYVNGRRVERDVLVRNAAGALKTNPETRTVIQASARAQHGSVIAAMDALREAGMNKIAFATDPASTPKR
jgi:biopolymer transport protein ExbD